MTERRPVPVYLTLHDKAMGALSKLVKVAEMPPGLGSFRSNPKKFGAGIIFNDALIITGKGKLLFNGRETTEEEVVSWLREQPLPGSNLKMPTDEEFKSMVHF